MAVGTLPVAAALTALSVPVMGVLAFGAAARGDGPELLGAALVGLAVGVPAYGGFLLLTRAAYALGDSRTPAVASLGSAVLGAGAMGLAAGTFDGAARLAAVGAAHTLAYAIGGLWLARRLQPRVGDVLAVTQLRPLVLALALGGGAWVAMTAWSPDGRIPVLVALAVIGAAGGAAYIGGLRVMGAVPARSPAIHRPLPGAQ